MSALPRWLTTAQVSDRLNVSRSTVRIWIRRGELPARRFGKAYRIPASALEMPAETNAGEEPPQKADPAV